MSSRLKTHQTSNPGCYFYATVFSIDFVRCEQLAHQYLAPFRWKKTGPGNEWFSCSKEKALEEVHRAVAKIDNDSAYDQAREEAGFFFTG